MKHETSPGSRDHVCGQAGGCNGRCEDKYGPALQVPAEVLKGARKEEKPCLTPIDCVLERRCAGHCGWH